MFNKNDITYESLKRSARHYEGENGYCSVIAIAVATGCKFGKARAMMQRAGRKNGKGAMLRQIEQGIAESGYRMKEVSTMVKTLKTAPDRLDDDKTYLLLTNGHISCVKYGKLQDWAEGRALKVWAVYEVVS